MAEAMHASSRSGHLVPGQRLGSIIGAVFGVIYLEANAGPLPSSVALALRLAGLAGGAAVVVAIVRTPSRRPNADVAGPVRPGSPTRSGRGYWLVVGTEAAALATGLAVLNGPLHAPRAGVAWVSFVVGAHFLPLSFVYGARLLAVLGVLIGACGVAGLSLAAAGAPAAPLVLVSGIVPGVLLLSSALYGARTV